jgi:hypothetical protein
MIVNLPEFIKGRILRLSAERIYVSQTNERFRIIGRDRSVIMEGHLPVLRTMKRKGDAVSWRIVSGQIKNQELYKKVLYALESKSQAGAFDEFPDLPQ